MNPDNEKRIFDLLEKIDERADQRHEQTIQRLVAIETSADNSERRLTKVEYDVEYHDRFINRAKGLGLLFSAIGVGGVWDALKNHLPNWIGKH